MDKISFQSRIRVTHLNEYGSVVSSFKKNAVKYPWTVKESVLANSAYTDLVYDCTVCGFTDGLKVLLLHICPTIKENLNFKKIEDFIKSKINLKNNENLQGFLLGSKKNLDVSPDSEKVFNFFEDLMEKYNIPFSKFKNSKDINYVAYSSVKDEWLIGNGDFNILKDNSSDFLKKHFEEVMLSEYDELA